MSKYIQLFVSQSGAQNPQRGSQTSTCKNPELRHLWL